MTHRRYTRWSDSVLLNGHCFHPGNHYCSWCGIPRCAMSDGMCSRVLIELPIEPKPLNILWTSDETTDKA